MRSVWIMLLPALFSMAAFSQSAPPAPPLPSLPKDPKAILAAAAPLYDFSSPALKPWHLKVSYRVSDDYRIFDDQSETSRPGTFEYWWAAPGVFRYSWTRAGATLTDWYNGGKHFHSGSGPALTYFERKLPDLLLHPVRKPEEFNQADTRFDLQEKTFGAVKMTCVATTRIVTEQESFEKGKTIGADSTYCFNQDHPVLRTTYLLGAAVAYNKIAREQGMLLAEEMHIYAGKGHILTASLDAASGMAASAPELTPSADAVLVEPSREIEVSSWEANGLVKKKDKPFLPLDAQREHFEQAVVELEAEIDADGHVRNLTPILGPTPSLVQAAVSAARGWEYTPFLLNGQPVPIRTVIYVSFEAGH